MSRSPARVILCGPFPEGGKIGGYARCNQLIAESFLDDQLGIARLALTVPGDGPLVQRMVRDLRATAACLRRESAPILHLTSQYLRGTPREYAIFRMAKAAGRKFVLDLRAGWFIESFDDPKAPINRLMLTAMLHGADAITVEGRRYQTWLQQRFGLSATYFPNFISERDSISHPPAPLDAPPPGQPCELVYVGRFVAQKGIEEAIDACGVLLGMGVPVRLHLAGSGDADFTRLLHQRAALLPGGTVVFCGTLDHGQILDLMARSHIFVFPTRWPGEGHSNALNEAMQTGLPLVTTRRGFLGDVVSAECGALLDEVTAQTVADAVASLARDWPRLQAAGRAARRRVFAEFSDGVALGRLGEVYRGLLGADGTDGTGR